MSTEQMCACGPRCGRRAVETPHSPNMNDYCTACTLHRCDTSAGMAQPLHVVAAGVPGLPKGSEE